MAEVACNELISAVRGSRIISILLSCSRQKIVLPVEPQPAAPVARRPGIWQLAAPTILSNLLLSIVALVQTKFVGGLGADAVAAVGTGQRVFFGLQAVLMAVGVGTTALIARAWGAGDQREAGRVMMASLVLGGVLSGVIMIVGMSFSLQIAEAFGLDDTTVHLAARNVFWLSALSIGVAINIIMSSALRASGDAWTPLFFGAAVNVINLPLLYMFIFGKWGAPRMGPAGAALGSGLSLTLCGAVLVTLWVKQRLKVRHVSGGWARRERYARLINISYPAALEQLVLQAGFLGFLMLIGNFYGTEAFAAYNVGVNMLNVGIMVGFGFSIAGSTLVGQSLGAGDFEAARRSGWHACRMAVISMAVMGVVIALNAGQLARFFLGDQPQTVRHTVEFTYILAAMLPLLGIELAIGGSLRGAGDTRFPLFSTFVGLLGMRCGLAAIFAWRGLPVIWVYGSIIGDYVLKAIVLTWRFRSGHWRYALSNRNASVGGG